MGIKKNEISNFQDSLLCTFIYKMGGHLRDPLDLSYSKKNYIFENVMITGTKWDTCGIDAIISENFETPYVIIRPSNPI